MKEGLVSIITPSHNSQQYVSDTIKSVRNQEYENWEHIIVDDASTDNTLNELRKLAIEDSRLKVISLDKNSGSAVARNKGIEHAKGEFITFIDSDDIWFPNFISRSLEEINITGVPFVFSSYRRSNEELEFIYSDFVVPAKVDYDAILKSNSIACLTAFIHLKTLGKKYMPLVRKRQDMGLWLRYLKDIPFAQGIKEPLAIYRIRENSLSRNKFKLISSQWYFYRNVEDLSLLKSAYYMVNWMYYGYLKYKN
ncbi:glycosyltransferase family 2 protein [Gangjinia marincola]|uniref:Glycosyltransferase family 2 protein n=1 Tax=Gangjinia marincola TaxID=578463 RepID=A0ABN1MIT4_9FLAO